MYHKHIARRRRNGASTLTNQDRKVDGERYLSQISDHARDLVELITPEDHGEESYIRT